MHAYLGSCLRVAVFANLVVTCLSQTRKFPPGFLLGTSTSSYQIEGAWDISGKGESMWDRLMTTNPNFTVDHQWGDIACDSFHLVDKDLEILRELGLDVYRFSLSWPRLLPTGYNDIINTEGVAYYNYLIDNLLASGIKPLVTIFHWDLPQSLQDIGGWTNPEIADYFVDYAKIVIGLFGDRVKLWTSINEPHHFCTESYGYGSMAPALNLTGSGEYKCVHNILRAHAKIYRIFKQTFAGQRGKMSITLDAEWYEPKNPSSLADIQAADRRLQFELGWVAHPIYTTTGGYPPVMVQRIREESQKQGLAVSRLPVFTPQERAALIGASDFFAVNHYFTLIVEDCTDDPDPTWKTPSRGRDMALRESNYPAPEAISNAVDEFSNVPWGFRKLLNWIRIQYNNPPVYITENGWPNIGGLEDFDRIDFHTGYLNALLDAIYNDHCNVVGYTCWSLMDNFEWGLGYTAKFGLYSVDFNDPNRKRTPKLSAKFFKTLGETRELPYSLEDSTNSADTRLSWAPAEATALAHRPLLSPLAPLVGAPISWLKNGVSSLPPLSSILNNRNAPLPGSHPSPHKQSIPLTLPPTHRHLFKYNYQHF